MKKDVFIKMIEQAKASVEGLPEEERAELEQRNKVIDNELEQLKETEKELKQEKKDNDLLLKTGDRELQEKLFAIRQAIEAMGLDIAELGLENDLPERKPSSRGSSGNKRALSSDNSRWFINGSEYDGARNEISYVLWYSTKGMGYGNKNGSLKVSEYEKILESNGIDPETTQDYQITIPSKNPDKQKDITIERKVIIEQKEQQADSTHKHVESLK